MDNLSLPQETDSCRGPRGRQLVAVSAAMRNLLDDVRAYADARASVLVLGETGVGKECIARLLHDNASWSRGPFVAVNCGAVPEGLFEAHFFGHAKGAFTGALGAHKGYFEQADGGTLFLDEIGDMPLYQQVKLLRVLEHKVVTRLGAAVDTPVDFRLVAATNQDLRARVAQGAFRADLYYRLAVIELRVPNLEERGPAEKLAIFKAFIDRELPGQGELLPGWLQDRVAGTRYPGNVRELCNLAERIALMRRRAGGWDQARIETVLASSIQLPAETRALPPASWLTPAQRAERERVLAALRAHEWRRQATAAALGISRKVLWEKMRKFELSEAAEPAAVAAAGS
ncbi:Sigma-54 factor interaction domain-containing protein [Bordetella sputigena]